MSRQQMIEEIQKYKKENGYYDTHRMHLEIGKVSPLEATFNDFFAPKIAEEHGEVHEVDPRIALADELNKERAAEEKQLEEAEVKAALERVAAGIATSADGRLLERHGLAVAEYNDPESNAPSSYRMTNGKGNPYADQEDIENKERQ